MCKMEVHPIGRVEEDEDGMKVVLDPAYGPALKGMERFGHVLAVWWFDRSWDTSNLVEK